MKYYLKCDNKFDDELLKEACETKFKIYGDLSNTIIVDSQLLGTIE